jgi:hypothetical protein
VSTRISPKYASGTWQAAAIRYSVILRAELARNGMTRKELGRRIGVTGTAVGYYCQARYLPHPDIASGIADALCSETLAKMTTTGAVIRCQHCGRERFRGTTRRKYCSVGCRQAASAGGTVKVVSGIQTAVDQFCHDCEPEGVCRDVACALQPFSPLATARSRVG